MALSFTVAFASSLEAVTGMTPSNIVYADDLNLCASCVADTGSCWSCLQITQQVFSDVNLTSPVADGFYMLLYGNDSAATWNIVGGYPQESGFYN
jgi:hypothetical protein